ncbi:MAG: methyltransferase domain-containing protein, partial [Bacteroidales bacterium]|nr:methyltransferase domain-containing protein [Bacteroidales bacterium]
MSLFRFKQFSVSHDFGMKIGTDAVLLGVWVSIQAVKNALDVGTGTGIIALMLAQRGINTVVGIDIDPKSVEEARFNVQQSPWKNSVS